MAKRQPRVEGEEIGITYEEELFLNDLRAMSPDDEATMRKAITLCASQAPELQEQKKLMLKVFHLTAKIIRRMDGEIWSLKKHIKIAERHLARYEREEEAATPSPS